VVGVQNYTFRFGEDIIRGSDFPEGFDAVLSGHIHRAQILKKDLSGRSLSCPVIYPGAIERTSFAESNETKGYYILRLTKDIKNRTTIFESEFIPIYARPMIDIFINLNDFSSDNLQNYIKDRLRELKRDSVVRIKVEGELDSGKLRSITAKFLRDIAPRTMNVELSVPNIYKPNKNR
ncbi:hypothetical protein ACFLQT_00870, partial [Bacteroidota bacterium]